MRKDGLSESDLIKVVSGLAWKPHFPYNQTSLEDWIKEGDTDDMSPQEIAAEWDELEDI